MLIPANFKIDVTYSKQYLLFSLLTPSIANDDSELSYTIDYRATYVYGIGNGRAPPIGLHGNASETIPRIHSAREDFDAAAPTTEVSSLVVATSLPGKLIDHINVVSWYNCTALCPV